MVLNPITKRGALLLGTAMILWSAPSHAGFEFSGATPAPVKQAAPVVADMPMPIVQAAPVTAIALDAPVMEQPSEASAPTQTSAGEPVYIRRQRSVIPLKAPKNQPMDTEALLRATEEGAPLSLTANGPQATPVAEGELVINPYPLDSGTALHGGGMGTLSVEQAMMEQTGALRAVAVPGKSDTNGMIERARISSRYGSGTQYISRAEKTAAPTPSNFTVSSAMTPIPGGEGEPLKTIERMPVAPMKLAAAPAPLPTPEASTPVIAPVPVAPAPAQSAAVVAERRSPSMPRPAVPQNYPTPVTGNEPVAAPVATPAVPSGTFTDAVGFGRDLPLALALSQIVPPEYSYSFGQNINVGTNVSWQGGKPWNKVLDDMLAPSGMKAVIQNNQIVIQKANS